MLNIKLGPKATPGTYCNAIEGSINGVSAFVELANTLDENLNTIEDSYATEAASSYDTVDSL